MKKILSYIFIFLILTSVFVPHSTFAQTATSSPSSSGGLANAAASVVLSSVNSSFVTSILSFIGYTALKMMAWLMWLSGIFLNAVLKFTVVDMSSKINAMTGINVAWKVIRDLLNIGFIFLLIWEGLKMIMGLKSSNAKNVIVGIITASLLINFSLFFTKVIIDASNIATIGFYNSIVPEAVVKDSSYGQGLSTAFAKAMGISEFYSVKGIEGLTTQAGNDSSNIFVISLMGCFLFLVASFVFLAVGVMFLVRYITLIVLLTLSPIAFFGMAYPGMKKSSSEWWDTLIGQCLFAPVYMIMTWVVITLMSRGGFTNAVSAGTWSNLVNGGAQGAPSASTVDLVINYALVIGLTLASLTTAREFAKKGAKGVSTATAAAGNYVLGGVSNVGKNSLGRFGNAVANNKTLQEAGPNSFTARLALQAGNKAAKSSFDVRNLKTGGVNEAFKDFGKPKAKDNDFRGLLADKAKSKEEIAKLFKPSDKTADEMKAKAQAEINSEVFKAAENVRYLETDQGKKDAETLKIKDDLSKAQEKVKELNTVREKLNEELRTQGLDLERENQVKREIQRLNEESTLLADNTKKLQKLAEEKKDVIAEAEKTRNKWESEVKKELISQTGGREADKKKGIEAIDSVYAKRVGAYADNVNNEFKNPILWGISMFTRPAAVVGLRNTAADRDAIARKIRAVAKSKKPKEEFEELLKKAGVTPADKEEEEKKEDKAPETPKPTT